MIATEVAPLTSDAGQRASALGRREADRRVPMTDGHPIGYANVMTPEQVLDLSKIARAGVWARQREPLRPDLGEFDLIALGERVTNRRHEHHRLAPVATLLKTFDELSIQSECDVGSAVENEASRLEVGQLADLNPDTGVMMFKLEQKSSELLARKILAEH